MMINSTPSRFKSGFKTMLIMIAWEIWKEINACVSRAKLPRVTDVLHAVKNDLVQWRLAGATC